MKFYMTGQNKLSFKYKCMLNTCIADHMDRFDCNN